MDLSTTNLQFLGKLRPPDNAWHPKKETKVVLISLPSPWLRSDRDMPNLGILYVWIIWTRSAAMIRYTVVTRILVLGFLSAFAIAGLATANIVVFGVVDALGAVWTEWALRRDERGLLRSDLSLP